MACGSCKYYQRTWETDVWPNGIPPKTHTMHDYGWCTRDSRPRHRRDCSGSLDGCYSEAEHNEREVSSCCGQPVYYSGEHDNVY